MRAVRASSRDHPVNAAMETGGGRSAGWKNRGGAPAPLAESERRRIEEALHAAGGNRARAARWLGISRSTMYRKLREPAP